MVVFSTLTTHTVIGIALASAFGAEWATALRGSTKNVTILPIIAGLLCATFRYGPRALLIILRRREES